MQSMKRRKEATGRNEAASSGGGRPLVVLVIDDDENVLASIRRQCDPSTIELVEAHNGVEGYRLALERMPDVVVTDLMMPMGRGEEVVDAIVHNPRTRHVPVIVMTGLSEHETKARVRSLNVARVLSKPLAFDDLLDAIWDCAAVATRVSPH